MKRILLFIAPILFGLLVFFSFVFFLSRSKNGNGALQITAVPVSNVYLNGKLLGKTPFCACEGKSMLASGTYSLKLVPLAGDNLLAYETEVTITKGILTVVDRTFGGGEFSSGSIITLIPLSDAKSTQLFVTSFPSDASVVLDGQSVGKTPLSLQSLTDSDHDLLLSKNGYNDKTVHVHAVTGYQLNAQVTLGLLSQDATAAANFQNASLTPVAKTQVTILDTPTGFLRVRSDPSLGASETAEVKPGDSFDFLGEQAGWYEIQLVNGESGWVSTQYAEKK